MLLSECILFGRSCLGHGRRSLVCPVGEPFPIHSCRSRADVTFYSEWTVVIPAYLMAVAMFTYVGYVALMAYHTPSFDSISYIAGAFLFLFLFAGHWLRLLCTDARGLIPDTLAKSLVCDLRDLRPDSASLYQAGDEVNTNPHDLPVATVNRILYPPRKRT